MNQPELGKKIVELRKARGLTQEELVTKCNLSVRTLQRIEAGEVTPRSYTIRTIFAALDFNYIDSIGSAQNRPGNTGTVLFHWLGQFYKYSIDLFNLRTNTMKKISILSLFVVAACFGLITIFSESSAQSPAKVRKAIEESNKNFVRWYNSGKLDSLVSLYRDDACLVGKGCGKTVVMQYFTAQLETGFKFKELSTYDLSIDNSLAVEKGRFTIRLSSGQEIQGEYITEWKLTKKKWLIASDMASTTKVDISSSGKW